MNDETIFRPPGRGDATISDLLNVFTPTIRIDVGLDRFVWKRKKAVMDLRTVVYLDSSRATILSVGEPPGTEAYSEVQLFPSTDDGSDAIRR